MNLTPKTDSAVDFVAENGLDENESYVTASFAEGLEIENNELREILAEMTDRY